MVRLTKECLNTDCKKSFDVPSSLKHIKYCSTDCYHKVPKPKKEPRKCSDCDAVIDVAGKSGKCRSCQLKSYHEEKGHEIHYNCTVCGEKIDTSGGLTGRKFCSPECYQKSREGRPPTQISLRVKKECEFCREVMELTETQASKKRFCSPSCSMSFRHASGWKRTRSDKKVTKPCPCGKLFEHSVYTVKSKYCSDDCRQLYSPKIEVIPIGKDCEGCSTPLVTGQKRFCSQSCAGRAAGKMIGSPPIPRTCANPKCGEKFLPPDNVAKNKYCCHDCYHQVVVDARKFEERKCLLCSSVFRVQLPSTRKYCSTKCKNIGTWKRLGELRSSKDGHLVRSDGEVIVDDWLYDKGLVHRYEPTIPGCRWVPDWICKGYVIEYWGAVGMDGYSDHMEEKRKDYEGLGLNLISIFYEDLTNLDQLLLPLLEAR